jgi:hypothetical protein
MLARGVKIFVALIPFLSFSQIIPERATHYVTFDRFFLKSIDARDTNFYSCASGTQVNILDTVNEMPVIKIVRTPMDFIEKTQGMKEYSEIRDSKNCVDVELNKTYLFTDKCCLSANSSEYTYDYAITGKITESNSGIPLKNKTFTLEVNEHYKSSSYFLLKTDSLGNYLFTDYLKVRFLCMTPIRNKRKYLKEHSVVDFKMTIDKKEFAFSVDVDKLIPEKPYIKSIVLEK